MNCDCDCDILQIKWKLVWKCAHLEEWRYGVFEPKSSVTRSADEQTPICAEFCIKGVVQHFGKHACWLFRIR